MAEVIIYTKDYCPYCTRAKQLLERKSVSDYTEHDVTDDEEKFEEMLSLAAGRKTVPQIFINGEHIGGYDDLAALDSEGKLEDLLAG